MGIMLGVYREHNERLQRAEPDDPNYLAPLAVVCRVLTPEEEVGKPWVGAGSPALWEWTPCVVVGEDGGYEKVEVGGVLSTELRITNYGIWIVRGGR